jgi:hypothetical protein
MVMANQTNGRDGLELGGLLKNSSQSTDPLIIQKPRFPHYAGLATN